MEFINGFTLGDVDGIKKSGLNLKDVSLERLNLKFKV